MSSGLLVFAGFVGAQNLRPLAPATPSSEGGSAVAGTPLRHITLAQAEQQAAQAANPMVRLGLLGVEAAKQHRLAATADYFPKIGTTFLNVHFNKFMGQQFTVARPVQGGTVTTALPLVGKDQTLVAVTAVQPITPLFKVREAVNFARADENIARAKAGMRPAETASAVEKNYFDLLVAQREMVLAEGKVRNAQAKGLIASNGPMTADLGQSKAAMLEAEKELLQSTSKVKELTASLNELLGWPADTRLELEPPAPLVENLSLRQAAGEALATNPEVIEAEQNVKKAQAATKLSKLDYVPDIALVGGYAYQANAIPLLPRDFSYVGVMGSFDLFDFGKREHSIRERDAQLQMAETALELTKAKVAASVKSSYIELERSRELSQIARRLESATNTLNVKYTGNDPDIGAAQARISIEMLELDYQHRQAYAKLKAIMGEW
jgi:outer membrane protein TolC